MVIAATSSVQNVFMCSSLNYPVRVRRLKRLAKWKKVAWETSFLTFLNDPQNQHTPNWCPVQEPSERGQFDPWAGQGQWISATAHWSRVVRREVYIVHAVRKRLSSAKITSNPARVSIVCRACHYNCTRIAPGLHPKQERRLRGAGQSKEAE